MGGSEPRRLLCADLAVLPCRATLVSLLRLSRDGGGCTGGARIDVGGGGGCAGLIVVDDDAAPLLDDEDTVAGGHTGTSTGFAGVLGTGCGKPMLES